MNHISGYISLRTGHITDISSGAFSYEDEHIIIRLLRSQEQDEGSIGMAYMAEVFRLYGNNITKFIPGLYLLMIYDKIHRTLYFYHGQTTYSLPLYYTYYRDFLFFSTSLKILFSHAGIQRVFDNNALKEFIINGYAIGSKTLVKNVYKLEPYKALYINDNHIEQIPVYYSTPEINEMEAMAKWNAVLEKSISRAFIGEREINLSISSGYDSNFIMYISSIKGSVPINAFSIGGREGKDELPKVRQNVKEYNDVLLYTAYTDTNSLFSLPDIVWRLEGALYECGIFLQYELLKLVQNERKSYLICGDCADQVMNNWFFESSRITVSDGATVLKHTEYPYLFGCNLVLKKNGIIANSFGIDVRYPYLNDEFLAISKAIRFINYDKQFHIQNCCNLLPDSIVKNMSKIGGSTDSHSLFESSKDIISFRSLIKRTSFYKKNSALLRECSDSHAKPLKSISKKSMLHRFGFSSPIELKSHMRNEIRLREHIGYAYLALFQELILSGKYDSLFNSCGIDNNLVDFYDLL